jgi:hypothetical protein
MTIDERLQFLVQATESLHAGLEHLHAVVAEQNRRIEAQTQKEERRHRAMLAAIQTYLGELDGNGNED